MALSATHAAVDEGLAVFRQSVEDAGTRIYEGEAYWWNGDSVRDPAALNRVAQRIAPGAYEKGHPFVFCSGNDTKLLPGRYQVAFRLKITAKPEPAVPVCRILAYNHGEPKWLFSTDRLLTTADFAQANAYEEFVLPLERYDISFAAFAVNWEKRVELFVDRVTVHREQGFTDAGMVAKLELSAAPTPLRVETTGPLRFLVLAGPYHRRVRVAEALARLPGATADTCYAVKDYIYGHSLAPPLPDPAGLSAYHAVLLLDVSAAPLHVDGRLALRQYAEGGGGVLVAGGPFAFGMGFYGGTFLADMLPVTDDGPWGLAPPGWRDRAKVLSGPLAAGLFSEGRTIVGWHHRFAARDGATVVMTAGGQPLVVTGPYRRGRVVAIGATPLGEPEGGTPLLESPDWPVFLARLLEWLAGRASAAPAAEGNDP